MDYREKLMIIRKYSDGNYYVCRTPGGSSNNRGRREKKVFRNWFLVKYKGNSNTCGISFTPFLHLPKEFVGKRIRLKVEVLK